MKKKGIILDLDNTIYPVSSIAEKLFVKLFDCIENSGEYKGNLTAVKHEIQRTPFQKVANDFSFSSELLAKCLNLHANLTYDEPMQTFPDYVELAKLPQIKYLVTSGFTKLQNSKVKQLEIENDFKEIYIIDLQVSKLTKKDVFREILSKNNYAVAEVLVVGDDLNSEIKAGNELGIETVLYDHYRKFDSTKNINTISNFLELKSFL